MYGPGLDVGVLLKMEWWKQYQPKKLESKRKLALSTKVKITK